MKKIYFLIFVLSSVLASCTHDAPAYTGNSKQHDKYGNEIIRINNKNSYPFFLMTFEVNGERHEYIQHGPGFQSGISHWEGCRYCKEHSKEK